MTNIVTLDAPIVIGEINEAKINSINFDYTTDPVTRTINILRIMLLVEALDEQSFMLTPEEMAQLSLTTTGLDIRIDGLDAIVKAHIGTMNGQKGKVIA